MRPTQAAPATAMRRSRRAGAGDKRPREVVDEPAAPSQERKRQAPPPAVPKGHMPKPAGKPTATKPVPDKTTKPASPPTSKSNPEIASQPAAKPAAKRAHPGKTADALRERAAAKHAVLMEKERTKMDARKEKEKNRTAKEVATEEKRRRADASKEKRERAKVQKDQERAEKEKVLENEWRQQLGQTESTAPADLERGALLKRRLLDRFFHSRAKCSCAHAMDRARKFKRDDTAVRAAAKTRKTSSGSAGGGVIVKFSKNALQKTMTADQLLKSLVALVSLPDHLPMLDRGTKIDELKALVEAYGGLVAGAATPKYKPEWLCALVACIISRQSESFTQPNKDMMLDD